VRDRARELERRFEAALRRNDFAGAEALAHELDWVSLRDALRLILIAQRQKPERVEPLARRWLERFLGECKPSLQLIEWVAEDFRYLQEETPLAFDRSRSEARLRFVVRTLKGKERMPTSYEYACFGRKTIEP